MNSHLEAVLVEGAISTDDGDYDVGGIIGEYMILYIILPELL